MSLKCPPCLFHDLISVKERLGRAIQNRARAAVPEQLSLCPIFCAFELVHSKSAKKQE